MANPSIGKLTLLLAWLLLAQVAPAGVSVAFVDAARVLAEAPQVEQIRRHIREEFSARDQRLVEMQKQIGLLEAQLASAGDRLQEEEKRRLQTDISTRRLKMKQARDELEQDKQLRFSEEEERLVRVMHEVVQQLAQDEKLDVVLQGAVLWVAPKVDFTGRVLERLRKMQEKGH